MYIKPDEFQELPPYLSPLPLFNAMFGSFTTVPAPKGNKNPESTPSWMDVAKSQDTPEPVAEAVPSPLLPTPPLRASSNLPATC